MSGVGGRDLVQCLTALQLLPHVCPHLVGIKRRRQQQKEEALKLVVCSMRRPIRLESAQQGVGGAVRSRRRRSESHQSAHSPMGLCDTLINALKFSANQQKDGDSPIQSIVTGLHEGSRRGITDGAKKIHRS